MHFTALDALLLGGSVFLIILILVAEARRGSVEPSPRLNPHMFALRIGLGILFVFLGIVGSLLPVLQGWMFFGIAALLLFPQSRFAIKALDKMQPRFPRVVRWLHHLGVGVHRGDENGSSDRDTIGA